MSALVIVAALDGRAGCTARAAIRADVTEVGLIGLGATTKVHVETMRLSAGWSARVLVGVEGVAPGTAPALPALDHWRPLLEKLTGDPTSIRGYEVLKYSDKGEVFRGQLVWSAGSLDIVCKRSRARGLGRRLFGAWRFPKERVNFDRGLALLRAGIATALPLAVIERRARRREAWLITAFVPDAVDLDQVALVLLPRLELRRQRGVKDHILDALVDLVEHLSTHGFHHRDLKASNILLTHWDSRDQPARPWLVDLEGLRLREASGARRRRRPLVRLAASLLVHASVTRADYCRFLQRYLARTGAGGETWKRDFRKLADGAARYVRRAPRRKRNKLDGYGGGA